MKSKYDNWSLDNWPESWEHDDWDDDLRRLSQRALGHNVLFTFFKEIPELDFLVTYLFDGGIVTCSFFGIEFILVLKTLSQLSRSKKNCVAESASNLLDKATVFMQYCLDFGESKVELYSSCVILEFAEAFYHIGRERKFVVSRLTQDLIKELSLTETEQGFRESDEKITSRYADLVQLIINKIEAC